MSCVCVIAPVVIATWPAFVAAALSAAAAAGFRSQSAAKKSSRQGSESVEIETENAQVVAEELKADDQLVVEKQGVRVVFSRDARGRFRTCVEGNLPKAELQSIGEDLSGRVIQHYVHQRLTAELQRQGFVTLKEEAGPGESIHLQVRRFEE